MSNNGVVFFPQFLDLLGRRPTRKATTNYRSRNIVTTRIVSGTKVRRWNTREKLTFDLCICQERHVLFFSMNNDVVVYITLIYWMIVICAWPPTGEGRSILSGPLSDRMGTTVPVRTAFGRINMEFCIPLCGPITRSVLSAKTVVE